MLLNFVTQYFRGHGWFDGQIAAFDNQERYYKVRFDDGDEEEYTENELERIVVDFLADVSIGKVAEESDEATLALSSSDSSAEHSLCRSHGIDRQSRDQGCGLGTASLLQPRFSVGTKVCKVCCLVLSTFHRVSILTLLRVL